VNSEHNIIYALWAQGLTTFVLYTCTFIDCPQVALLHEIDKAEILPINKFFYLFASKLFKSIPNAYDIRVTWDYQLRS